MLNRREGARRLFLRFAVNNVLILALPVLVAAIYYTVSIGALRDGIDSFAEAQLGQSIDAIDREFRELDEMMTRLSNDYDVNVYLSKDGRFTDIEYYNIHQLSEKLAPHVFGSPIVSNILLYLHRSRVLITESGFGYYDDYYGPVVSVGEYSASQWRNSFLLSIQQQEFVPSVEVAIQGDVSRAHLYRSNIGYGNYFLGTVVAVISDRELRSLLAQMPAQYGGWVHVAATDGTEIASTYRGAAGIVEEWEQSERAGVYTLANQRLRLYRRTSPVTGWQYTAAVDETQVYREMHLVRTIALALLTVSLVLGLSAAYFFAFRTSKPWTRLFELARPEQYAGSNRPVSAYAELESAIEIVADRDLRLQAEIGAAEQMTRNYFFQNVLRGHYRNRDDFDRERDSFGISFAAAAFYVVIARKAPLAAALADETFAQMRTALTRALEQSSRSADFIVPMSFDDVVIVRSVTHGVETGRDAVELVTLVRNAIDPTLRGDYWFGVGNVVEDPFLLTISYNQAMAAVTPADGSDHGLLRFYSQISDSTVFYSYPLDVEENLIRAVRSGNRELVANLLESVRSENFRSHELTDTELDDLFVELKGTALKLYKALPDSVAWSDETFLSWWAMPSTEEKLDAFAKLCASLSERFDSRKRSHNSALLASIQSYIESHYADVNLSLTAIAEAFKRSENYLSSFYKEQTGTGLAEALQRIRLEQARQLISNEFEPLATVAERCGYASTASFRRAFKREYGLSPSEYRARSVS